MRRRRWRGSVGAGGGSADFGRVVCRGADAAQHGRIHHARVSLRERTGSGAFGFDEELGRALLAEREGYIPGQGPPEARSSRTTGSGRGRSLQGWK